MKNASSVELALQNGSWVKLICGASNEDLASIADLCAVYAVAGVHCIDVAADHAVARAAREGLDWVDSQLPIRPWLMVSVSDGQDIHFRKAFFDPNICPKDCARPCEKACPANAISNTGGIIEDQCYGCGRCLPVCPKGLIKEKEHFIDIKEFGEVISKIHPDAVEIHTAPGRIKEFEYSVKAILESKVELKRIAVSCGLEGHGINANELANELWLRHACLRRYNQKPIWQLDGRPMSGDIGPGSAKAAISLWENLLAIAPPGPLQLAGGTNSKTINYLDSKTGLAGIAFGGMARKAIQPFLLRAQQKNKKLRECPEEWNQALVKAKELVTPWIESKV